jgi:hypothetical protein
MEIIRTEPQPEERLPWHKPEVQQLVITLDTGVASRPLAFSEVDGPTEG